MRNEYIRISVTRIKVKEIAMMQVHHDMYRYAHFLRGERREAVNKNVTRVGSRKVCHEMRNTVVLVLPLIYEPAYCFHKTRIACRNRMLVKLQSCLE